MTDAWGPAKETLGQRAYREIRDSILSGEFAPSERLSIRRLGASLKMGMAPIGEALRELGRDGLIELERGWGARVRRMDGESIRSHHILRTAIECEAARQCALLATEQQFIELLNSANELDGLINAGAASKEIQNLDYKFHLRVAELSGVASLVEALRANQLIRLLARTMDIGRDVKRPKRFHARLVEALRTRDPDRAEAAMREHCDRAMALLVPHLKIRQIDS